jgi:hypothetical protein
MNLKQIDRGGADADVGSGLTKELLVVDCILHRFVTLLDAGGV